MIDFQAIKAQYPAQLQGFEKAILREYLQYKILQAIFESKQASKVSFIGGTALRIVHGNTRFSEDIDLDDFGLSWDDFDDLIQTVTRFLEWEGYQVEVRNVARGAYHCYLRFPEVLHHAGISPLPTEKILIQLDTISQGYVYQPEMYLLNKFDIFTEIRVTPLSLLLSQKIYTAVHRKRAKGRDFYDITFLYGLTKPDFGFLSEKMGIDSPDRLHEEFLEKIEGYDFEALVQDVAPFLINQNEVNRVRKFREFWQQISTR
ncbi:MAG: nucleotidyl transferase AbiEii/AbiGii toxin family protein [Anaerolineae bacterium]|nr:nucleotidyl transferase AbiEii/AbiGii toxin family protein [Anaerolineae bacterium]